MNTLVQYAALICVAAGITAGLLALAVSRDIRVALRIALDLWLAAGLLRLAVPTHTRALLAAAAIVGVRQLVGLAFRSGPSRARPGASASSTPGGDRSTR